MCFSSADGDWSDLPPDVWFSIGLKLDAAADRIRFRAVSKTFRSHLPFRQPPLLMLSMHDPSGECEIVWDDEPDNDAQVEEVETESDDGGVDIESDNELDVDDEPDDDAKVEEVETESDDGGVDIESDNEFDVDDEPVSPRRFLTVGEQEIYRLYVPEVYEARCVGSTGNWLVTVKPDTVVRLLNPFTRIQIDLPSQSQFEYRLKHPEPYPIRPCIDMNNFLMKAIICLPPSGNIYDSLVVAIHDAASGRLAMVRPGDEVWADIKTDIPKGPRVVDIVMYKGLLYAITSQGLLLSCDIHTHPNPPQLQVFADKFDKFPIKLYTFYNYQQLYLVECCGHLLFVVRFIESFGRDDGGTIKRVPFYKTRRFEVYQFDFTTRKWNELKSLGEYSLFLGYNTSVSLLASEYYGWVEKNCIYFTDDYFHLYFATRTRGGYDMGVFDLDDHSIKPHYNGISSCFFCPPIWIVPT